MRKSLRSRKRNKVNLSELATTARNLAEELFRDVEQAGNREDHIRVTARANEARNLADNIEALAVSSTGADAIV